MILKQIILTCLHTAIFSLTVYTSSAQPLGIYEQTKGLDHTQVHLLDTGFLKITGHTLSHGAFLTKGVYQLIGDTLLLEASPWVRKDSYFEIIDQSEVLKPKFGNVKKIDSTFLSLDITIFDENRQVIPHSIISLLDTNAESVATILGNEHGKFYYYDNNGTITSLRFLGLFKPLDIELTAFKGYATSLNVILRYYDHDSYNQRRFKEKYHFNPTDSTLTYIGVDSLTHTLEFKSN